MPRTVSKKSNKSHKFPSKLVISLPMDEHIIFSCAGPELGVDPLSGGKTNPQSFQDGFLRPSFSVSDDTLKSKASGSSPFAAAVLSSRRSQYLPAETNSLRRLWAQVDTIQHKNRRFPRLCWSSGRRTPLKALSKPIKPPPNQRH